MLTVHFSNEWLEDEAGNQVRVKEDEILEACIKHVEVSSHVINIIKMALLSLGYDLDPQRYAHRKSKLFNSLETQIVHSEQYQTEKKKKQNMWHIENPNNPYFGYVREQREGTMRRIRIYEKKRPGRFSHKTED